MHRAALLALVSVVLAGCLSVTAETQRPPASNTVVVPPAGSTVTAPPGSSTVVVPTR
jgi:hypothetical protein